MAIEHRFTLSSFLLTRNWAQSLFCAGLLGIIVLELATSSLFTDPNPPGERQPSHAAETVQRSEPDLDALVGKVVDRPLFTPGRQPPAAAESEAAPEPSVQEFHARLAGTFIGPNDQVAFFSPPGEETLAVRVGDDLKGWKVEAIEPDLVTISGPSGEKRIESSYIAPGDGGVAVPPKKHTAKKPKVTVVAPIPPAGSQPNPAAPLRPGVAVGNTHSTRRQ